LRRLSYLIFNNACFPSPCQTYLAHQNAVNAASMQSKNLTPTSDIEQPGEKNGKSIICRSSAPVFAGGASLCSRNEPSFGHKQPGLSG
jgi:hypothetical protein